jgi:hypothetical protein
MEERGERYAELRDDGLAEGRDETSSRDDWELQALYRRKSGQQLRRIVCRSRSDSTLSAHLLALPALPVELSLRRPSVRAILLEGLRVLLALLLGRRPAASTAVCPAARPPEAVAAAGEAALLTGWAGKRVEGVARGREGRRERVGPELVHVGATDEQRLEVRRHGRGGPAVGGGNRVHAHHERRVVHGDAGAVGRVRHLGRER